MNFGIKIKARQALVNDRFCGISVWLLLTLFHILSFAVGAIIRYEFGARVYLPVSALLSVFTFAAIAVMKYSAQRKYIALSFGKANKRYEAIGIKTITRAFFLRLELIIRKTGLLAAYEFLPLVSSAALLMYLRGRCVNAFAAAVLVAGICVLALLGYLFYAASVQKYSRALFLLASYDAMKPSEAIRESVRTTKNECFDILMFKLSFFPWFLLCLTVFPVFFVLPYYKQSLTIRLRLNCREMYLPQ